MAKYKFQYNKKIQIVEAYPESWSYYQTGWNSVIMQVVDEISKGDVFTEYEKHKFNRLSFSALRKHLTKL